MVMVKPTLIPRKFCVTAKHSISVSRHCGERPLNSNLFIELVQLIKQVDIGIRAIPGTALKNDLGEVIYTPPVGEAVIRDKLANLEQFIHADDGLDPLVKMAVMHYNLRPFTPFRMATDAPDVF